MKLQWSIQPRHTQLALGRVTNLNYRSMHIWPPKKLDYIILKLFIWLHTFHDMWSFWNNTSPFEIDAWNFWYFNLMSKHLAFGHHTFSYKSLSLFPSWILVCAMAFAAHPLFSFWDLTLIELFQQKNKRVGRYISASLWKSQDQQNHWLIVHDKFEDLFTIVTYMSRYFPQWYECIENKQCS